MILFWWWMLQRARRAARAGDWAAAAAAYRYHLARHPGDPAAWMQLGHALKEQGDLPGATAAYHEAVRIAPAVADSWVHLAFLERGDRETALVALERAIAADDGSAAAITALLAIGERERLPAAVQRRIEAEEGAYARARYAAWRETQEAAAGEGGTDAGPLPSTASLPDDALLVDVSPAGLPAGDPLAQAGSAEAPPDVLAVIDGRGAAPGWIALTRATLGKVPCLIISDKPSAGDAVAGPPVTGHAGAADASAGGYADGGDAVAPAGHAVPVVAGARLAPGPVASVAVGAAAARASAGGGDGVTAAGRPIALGVTAYAAPGRAGAEGGAGGGDTPPPARHLLLVEAGTRLAPGAVAALAAAIAGTGAGTAYGDHDHWAEADGGVGYRDPCFQPMFDPIWFARAAVRPPCLMVTGAAASPHATWAALFAHRLALPVAYAHVPRLIASRAADAVAAPVTATDPHATPPAITCASPGANPGMIQVIVQTRDAPEMLEACVDTLRATADRPELLDIVIMDNRSVLPRTAALLAGWAAQGIARTIAHDEPFNWARANNLAATAPAGQGGDAPYLLFLNNDVEMASAGWDTALRAGLALDGVGAMGALLLYPDGLIQHAGVVFAMGDGGPLHEGIGQPPATGPADRWRHPRLAAAVTGAWLAVTRTLFATVGGFEERLPVGYNDIDFCLRVRAAGQGIMQASHIVALHRESATRGLGMSATARARDEADWGWMRDRWGAALDRDPAYNPHWLRIGQPFDGLATPSDAAAARWTMASARTRPWRVTTVAAGAGVEGG